MSEWSTLRSIWRIRQTSTMGKVMPLLPLIPLAGVLPSTLPQSRRTEAMLSMVPWIRNVMPKSLNEQFGGFLDPQTVEVGLPAIGAFSAYFQDLLDGMKGRKKLVLHSFNVPPEIFHAMGVAPIFTELLTTLASMMSMVFSEGAERYIDYCHEKGLPDSLCSGQLGGLGAILMGDVPTPDLIISGAPGSCDTNSKSMEYFSKLLNKPLLQVDTPAYNGDRGLDYYKDSFRDLISSLEKITGNKLDPDKLREVVENSNKVTELYVEINELKRAIPNPVPNIYSLLSYGMKYSMSGRKESIPVFKAALESSKKKMKKKEGSLPEENIRSLWLFTPVLFDPRLIGWFNDIGMTVLMDVLGWFPMNTIDTSSTDSMIDGLAEVAFNYPMTRQMRGPGDAPDSWADDMVFLAKKLKADCCIYTGHLSCKRTQGSFRLASDRIKDEVGIPTLTLEADSWDKRITSTPVIKERIEDFIEMVA